MPKTDVFMSLGEYRHFAAWIQPLLHPLSWGLMSDNLIPPQHASNLLLRTNDFLLFSFSLPVSCFRSTDRPLGLAERTLLSGLVGCTVM